MYLLTQNNARLCELIVGGCVRCTQATSTNRTQLRTRLSRANCSLGSPHAPEKERVNCVWNLSHIDWIGAASTYLFNEIGAVRKCLPLHNEIFGVVSNGIAYDLRSRRCFHSCIFISAFEFVDVCARISQALPFRIETINTLIILIEHIGPILITHAHEWNQPPDSMSICNRNNSRLRSERKATARGECTNGQKPWKHFDPRCINKR